MSDTTLSKEEKQYKRLTGEPVARLVLELGPKSSRRSSRSGL